MKRIKSPIFILSIALMFMFLVGCNSNSSSNGNTTTGDTSKPGSSVLRVGMITGEGGLGDKSFNDAAYEGLLKSKENLDIEFQVLEPKQESEYESFLSRLSQSSDLVICVGYKLKDALSKVSVQNPSVKYVLIDDVLEGSNIHNLTFKEEEGSFLAGVMAGVMTETNKIGFMGGTDTPLIEKFESGFVAGVKSVNPEAGALLENGNTVSYVGGFSDISKGYEIAKSMYNNGIDIIYHAAGGAGIGLFRAASESGNYAIGVDSDQAVSLPEYSDVILTSVVKNLRDSVYNVLSNTINGGFISGTSSLGIDGDNVYLADGKITQEALDRVNEFKTRIIDGTLKVPSTIEELSQFVVN